MLMSHLLQETSAAFTRSEHGHKEKQDKQEREREKESKRERARQRTRSTTTKQEESDDNGGCMLGLCGKGESMKVAGGVLY